MLFLQFVKEALEKLSSMSDAFFGRLVPSEDLVIRTVNLAISLKKVSADDIKGLGMEEGPTKVKLPGNLGDMGSGNINAKVRRLLLAWTLLYLAMVVIPLKHYL